MTVKQEYFKTVGIGLRREGMDSVPYDTTTPTSLFFSTSVVVTEPPNPPSFYTDQLIGNRVVIRLVPDNYATVYDVTIFGANSDDDEWCISNRFFSLTGRRIIYLNTRWTDKIFVGVDALGGGTLNVYVHNVGDDSL
jgi:hypothetical protein